MVKMAMTFLESFVFTGAVVSSVWVIIDIWKCLGQGHIEGQDCENNKKFMNTLAQKKFYRDNSLNFKKECVYYH